MKSNELTGVWKLVSYNYNLPNGETDENVKIKTATRLYTATHFTVFYEYENGSTEICVTKYKLSDDIIDFEILFHTEKEYVGKNLEATSFVKDKNLHHLMNMEGYQINEIYELMH